MAEMFNNFNFEQLLNIRHSCRKYISNEPISTEQIFALYDAIKKAPYASGGPRLEYFTIENPERRALIKAACMDQQYVGDASVQIVFCGKEPRVKLRQGFSKFVFDCAFACAQAHLMATALGLGSCVIGNFIPERIAEILEIDVKVLRPTLILIVGYRDRRE